MESQIRSVREESEMSVGVAMKRDGEIGEMELSPRSPEAAMSIIY